MGRLVWNHSTHAKGLIPVLRRLVKEPGIKTVTPGKVKPLKGNGCDLRITVTSPLPHGWRLKVRRGRLLQEVFVVTEFDQATLQTMIDRLR